MYQQKYCSTSPIGRDSNYILNFRGIYVRTISEIFVKNRLVVLRLCIVVRTTTRHTHFVIYNIYIYTYINVYR